jgi:hypothetical protein
VVIELLPVADSYTENSSDSALIFVNLVSSMEDTAMVFRSQIRFGWVPWRKRAYLLALMVFYRIANIIGLSELNVFHVDLTEYLFPVVDTFAASGDFSAVYNFQASDGRIFTVMITQVRDKQEVTESTHV